MAKDLRMKLFLVAALFVSGSQASAQKSEPISPPEENASTEEVQKWLSGTLVKYGSYKTRVGVVDISNVRFEGCTIKYTVSQKSGSTSTAVMGATRTVNTTKEEVSLPDPALMTNDRVKLSDNVYSELQTIEIVPKAEGASGFGDDRPIELVVKREAAKAIRAALLQLSGGCAPKN